MFTCADVDDDQAELLAGVMVVNTRPGVSTAPARSPTSRGPSPDAQYRLSTADAPDAPASVYSCSHCSTPGAAYDSTTDDPDLVS